MMTTTYSELEATIEYPASDGQPLGETDLHRILMNDLMNEDRTLRLYNRETGERLPTANEVVLARRKAEARQLDAQRQVARINQVRQVAEARAAEQAARAEAAEAQLAQLRAERGIGQ